MLYAIVPHVSRITALQIGSSYLNPRPSDECIAQLGKIERVQVSNIYPTLNMAYDNHPIREATCVIDSSVCLSVNRFVDLMEFYKRRCQRLKVLVFEELHATQLIMYDLIAGLGALGKICHAVRADNDGVIAFSKFSLSDPALIALIRDLSIYSTEKKLGISFKIYIEKEVSYSTALMGRLIHRHLSKITDCIDDGPHYESDSARTYAELLAELACVAPHAAGVWRLIMPLSYTPTNEFWNTCV
jgi:hypothetical protein